MSIVNSKSSGSNYKWYVLSLAALTLALTVGMPMMSIPVLFKEISGDLELSLVQIGVAWGAVSLGGMCVLWIGGLLGDRFGAKRTLSALCFLTGLAGALIGLSDSFISLAVTMFLFGLLNISIPINLHKAAGTWFPGRQLGLANGIVALGMGLGYTAGAMISATILSPLLGGWRNVMFLYGALSVGISVLWILTRSEPGRVESSASSAPTVALRQSLSQVTHIRGVWLIGFILLGQMACITGVIGYLPLYLREMGWTAANADGALAAANAASAMVVVPIAFLSDKLGSRKTILLALSLITAISVGLLPVASGVMIWALVIMAIIFRDGFAAIGITMLTETKGVGAVYAGTALGIAMTLGRLGGFISPPLGNSLAEANPGFPFFLWAAFGLLSLVAFCFLKETRRRRG